jgi:hypothetical protein
VDLEVFNMKLGWKDVAATVLLAAIVVPYGIYLANGPITFIQDGNGGTAFGLLDPTGMAGWALVFGVIAAMVGGWIAFGEGVVTRWATGGLGVLSAALGVLALVGENLFNNTTVWESVLAAFVASIVLLWGVAITRHAAESGGQAHATGMTPA